MKKNYLYAVTIVLVSLTLWIGYCIYCEIHPREYKHGILVELPVQYPEEEKVLFS